MKQGAGQDTAATGLRRLRVIGSWGLGLASALILLFMMGLTSADVVARYIFNAPIQGAFELIEISMVVFIYIALPLAVLASAHVEVELWEPKTTAANKARLVLAGICGLVVFAAFAVELSEHAAKFAKRETVTNSLEVPLKYIAYAATAGAVLSAIFTVTVLIERLRK